MNLTLVFVGDINQPENSPSTNKLKYCKKYNKIFFSELGRREIPTCQKQEENEKRADSQ